MQATLRMISNDKTVLQRHKLDSKLQLQQQRHLGAFTQPASCRRAIKSAGSSDTSVSPLHATWYMAMGMAVYHSYTVSGHYVYLELQVHSMVDWVFFFAGHCDPLARARWGSAGAQRHALPAGYHLGTRHTAALGNYLRCGCLEFQYPHRHSSQTTNWQMCDTFVLSLPDSFVELTAFITKS